MRSHAKASTAGSTQRQRLSGLGRIFRGAFATRASSRRADGSGVPSHGKRLAALGSFALVLTALVLLVASASASQEVFNYFGSPGAAGSSGGEFNRPAGVAVNDTGNGPADQGDIYVADESNNRIERFDAHGGFVSAWGKDVIAPSVDERQKLTLDASGGTYTLTFSGSTTEPINYNASEFGVRSALGTLTSVGGSANVAVAGSVQGYVVTFKGALAATDLPQMTADTSRLEAADQPEGSLAITTLADGTATTEDTGTGFELCKVASECKAGVGSGENGALDHPQSVAVDSDTGDVYVSDRNNRRIDEYEGDGTFVRAFGWNVIKTDEVQAVTVAATSGDFTLSFQGEATGELEATAEASEVETALNGLATIEAGGGSVSVSGGPGDETGSEPYVVSFDGGPLAHSNVAQLTATDVSLAGGSPSSEVTVATTAPGGGVNEYGVCEPSDICKAGAGGSGVGQYGTGTATGGFGIAVSPPDGNASTGTVFFADSGNRRVDTFELDGSSPSSFGSSADFGTAQPRTIAVDSRGIVYASDLERGGEIERYDSEDANGGGVGFLAPIEASRNERQEITFTGFVSDETNYTLTCPNGDVAGPSRPWASYSEGPQRLRDELEGSCGSGNFRAFTSGTQNSKMTVEFIGSFGGIDEPTMTCTKVTEPSVGGCSVSTVEDGAAGPLLDSGRFAEFSTNLGFAVHPDSDGAGPDSDTLFVLRRPELGSTVVQEFGPDHAPGLTAPPGAADGVDGAGAEFGDAYSLGLNDAAGQLLVAAGRSVAGIADRVYILSDPESFPAPQMELDPITTKTDTTAAVSGSVDPMGAPVRCRYQYSTDQVTWTDVPEPGCALLDPDGGPQAISRRIAGLDPNTHYYVRLVTSRPYVQNSDTISAGLRAFDTDAVPPVLSDVGAVQVDDTSARLVGTIDPRNSATGYVFEYGATPALGRSTAPTNIGGGTEPITVSQVVEGLSRDTTYYFRLVATNLTGTTTSGSRTLHTRSVPFPPANSGSCPNEARREEQGTTYLPDCRAFEMVSPPDKNHGTAVGFEELATFSRDGAGAFFCSSNLFGEPAGQQSFTCAPYVSHREADGWATTAAGPRYCNVDTASTTVGALGAFPSPESFDSLAVNVPEASSCPFALDPLAPKPQINLYVGDEASGYDLLTPEADAVGEELTPVGTFQAGNADFSHFVYYSTTNQTAGSPPQANFDKLYDWRKDGTDGCSTAGGCLSLISVDPSGHPFESSSKLPDHQQRYGFWSLASSVAGDGRRIFFQNPAGTGGLDPSCAAGCELYMREDDATTHDVSASECTEGCGGGSPADAFAWADPAGDRALFLSCAKLTDASAPAASCSGPDFAQTSEDLKLYRWDLNAPAGHHLVDLTVDREPADGVQPQALDPIGAGDDGNTVFFVAGGQIVAGASTAPGLKLYRWRWNEGAPSVDYLGPYQTGYPNQSSYSSERPQTATTGDPNTDRLHVRVTPDGKYLLVQTRLRYDPAADRDSDEDLYRWDEADGWQCVSCQLPGVPSAGGAGTAQPNMISSVTANQTSFEPEHTISDDGQRVFFETPDALVPQDVNGVGGCEAHAQGEIAFFNIGTYNSCDDVYEWHDGAVHLLTPGTGNQPFILMGATKDGRSVFFYTRQQLVGWDKGDGADIYVARAGGGFPEPPPQPAACEGEGCRGAGPSAPSIAGAGSAAFEAPAQPAAPGDRCTALGRRALNVSRAAKRLRHSARLLIRRAHRTHGRRQARRLRRRAHRLAAAAQGRAKLAGRLALRTKRCRRAGRGAGR